MKKLQIIFLSILFFGLSFAPASAVDINLFDWAFNIDGVTSEDFWEDSMPVDGILTDGLGLLEWSTNAAGPHNFIAFFDHDIDEELNTYFNEFGTTFNTLTATQSWEIDEPGYLFGNIYDNVLDGSLDNTNSVPAGQADDVSWAMGWDFSLDAGQSALISIKLGNVAPTSGFYLSQTDPDSNSSIYFSSTINVIPEPTTLLLMGTGLLGLLGVSRKRFHKKK